MDPEVGLGRRLDEIAANATPAALTSVIDGWLCKRARDLPFRRANAVLPPMGAGRDPAATGEALVAIEDWYGATDQRVLIQVSSADPASDDLDALLAERGYGVEAPVDLMVGDLGEVAGLARPAARFCDVAEGTIKAKADGHRRPFALETSVHGGTDPAWARSGHQVHGASGPSNERTAGYRRMLQPLGRRALEASASTREGADVASSPVRTDLVGVGYALAEQEWMGLFGMFTSPEWRGRRVATALVLALAEHAAAHDLAEHVYLQVETDNAPAQALYRGLGFTRHHGYHYRVSEPWRPTAQQPVDSGC